MLSDAMRAGKSILFEGAQGTLLDIDHGNLPVCDLVERVDGGVCTGLGVRAAGHRRWLIGDVAQKPIRPASARDPLPDRAGGRHGSRFATAGMSMARR